MRLEIWPDKKVEKLRRLWYTDMTIEQIAEEFRVSYRAVRGKAWRLGLPPKKKAAEQGPPIKSKPTFARKCAWPIGHPGEPDFHFCGTAVSQGKPYCAYHCKIAYVQEGEEGET